MFQVILLIASFQALFFSMLLITKKNKKVSDKYLYAWLMILVVQILFIYRSINPSEDTVLPFDYLAFCLSMLHGVFLFLYTKSLTIPHSTFRIKQLLHFTLCACCIFAGLTVSKHITIFTPIVRSLSLVVSLAYIILSLQTIRSYQSFLAEHFSSTEKLNLDWLKFLIYGLLFFCVGAFIFMITPQLFHIDIPLNDIFSVLILIFIAIIGFKGLKQSTVFNEMLFPTVEVENNQTFQLEDENKADTYANYGLKDNKAVELSELLKEYMEKDKPFTNPELSLKDLAITLKTYPHYISQVLNSVFHQNFYDFVNTYRVEEAKKQLLDDKNKHLTILAIAYDCGFNSKSSFNRVFKQKTGITPSEFTKSDMKNY